MKNISVIVYDLTIEYNISVLSGVVDYFKDKEDVRLFISTVNVPNAKTAETDYQYWTAVKILQSKSIDGVIVIANSFSQYIGSKEFAKELEFLSPKVIGSVGMPLNVVNNKYTFVSCEEPYRQLITHLVEKHGRKKIAFMSAGLIESHESDERVAAYKKILKELNLEFHEDWIFKGDFTPGSAMNYFWEHFKKKEDIFFDTLLCANDYMAGVSVQLLNNLGLKVPDDVIVAGFDNSDICLAFAPTLTTISQQVPVTGAKAAEAVYRTLHGDEIPVKTEVFATPVLRQSCGCLETSEKEFGSYTIDGEYVPREQFLFMNLLDRGMNDMANIYKLLNLTDTSTSVNVFFESLKKIAPFIHLPVIAICLYKNESLVMPGESFIMPRKAKLILHIDDERKIYNNYFEDNGGIEFSPYKELLPDNLSEFSSGNFFLLPIFIQNINYGYVVCKCTSQKHPYISIVLKIICSAFVHAYEVTRKEAQKNQLAEENRELNIESKTDELTKVLNRRGFYEIGQQMINFALETDRGGAVFFCDLDGLKTINDTYGHKIGDLAIQTEAQVLKVAFRDSDLVGRLSGDEFGVVAPGIPIAKIDDLRKRLVILNEEYSKKNNLPFTLSISIGPMQFTKENYDIQKLLVEADKNLYEEKKIKHAARAKQ